MVKGRGGEGTKGNKLLNSNSNLLAIGMAWNGMEWNGEGIWHTDRIGPAGHRKTRKNSGVEWREFS